MFSSMSLNSTCSFLTPNIVLVPSTSDLVLLHWTFDSIRSSAAGHQVTYLALWTKQALHILLALAISLSIPCNSLLTENSEEFAVIAELQWAVLWSRFLQGPNNHANHNYSAISVKHLKTGSFDLRSGNSRDC